MKVFGVAVLLMALVCQVAIAEEQTQADPVSALAERYIADAQASGIFIVATDPNVALPRVRHQASGMICTLSSQFTASRLRIVDGEGSRGDQVVCSTSNMWVGQAIFLRRLTTPMTLEEDLNAFQAEVIGSSPSLRADRRAPALDEILGADEQTVALGDGRNWSYLRVAHVNGWSVRMRISAQQGAAQLLVQQANREWTSTIRSLGPATP